MFENSLVESSGRIRTRSKWYALGSVALEAIALAALILIPFVYPAALPPDLTLDDYALASITEEVTDTDVNKVTVIVEGLLRQKGIPVPPSETASSP